VLGTIHLQVTTGEHVMYERTRQKKAGSGRRCLYSSSICFMHVSARIHVVADVFPELAASGRHGGPSRYRLYLV
jgi:hypothetical protein